MKENESYQGYIESENFGQSRTLVAFKIALEDWSVYRTPVNNCYKVNFLSKTVQPKLTN